MLLPITDVIPSSLQRFPHPKTPELGELGVGEHVGGDQEQRPATGTTPLLSVGEVPLAMGAVIALRLGCQVARPKIPQIMVLFVEAQGISISSRWTATPWARTEVRDERPALRNGQLFKHLSSFGRSSETAKMQD